MADKTVLEELQERAEAIKAKASGSNNEPVAEESAIGESATEETVLEQLKKRADAIKAKASMGGTATGSQESVSNGTALEELKKRAQAIRNKGTVKDKPMLHSMSVQKVTPGAASQEQVRSWVDKSMALMKDAESYYGNWSGKDGNRDEEIRKTAVGLMRELSSVKAAYAGNQEAVAAIDGITKNLLNVYKGTENARKYYGQWDSQEAYDEAVADYQLQQEVLKMDASQVEAEVKTMEDKLKDLQSRLNKLQYIRMNPGNAQSITKTKNELEAQIGQLEGQLKEKKKLLQKAQDMRSAQEQAQLEQEALKLDMEKAAAEIRGLEANLEYLKNLQTNTFDKDTLEQLAPQIEEMEKTLREKKNLYQTAQNLHGQRQREEHRKKLEAVSGNADFKANSGYDASYGQEGVHDPHTYEAMEYDHINGETSDVSDRYFKDKHYDQMEPAEVAVYNYYFKTHGIKTAKAYLDSLQETLNARYAKNAMEGYRGKTGKEILFGAKAGWDQAMTGLKNLDKMVVDVITGKDSGYIAPSGTQMLSGMIREDLDQNAGKLATVGYDIINTTANMLPSILASTAVGLIATPGVGSTVGAAMMGGGAAGNAYQEVLNMGFSPKEAAAYGTAIGISEAALERVLGGIGKLGGTSAKIAEKVAGIENGIARFCLRFGGKIGSEALEEGLQSILEPGLSNWILDTDKDVDWSEVAYSALLGGLTGGVFGAVDLGTEAVAGKVVSHQQAKAVGQWLIEKGKIGAEDVQAIVESGLESPQGTESHSLAEAAQKKLESGKTLDDAELGRLYLANVEQVKKEDAQQLAAQTQQTVEPVADGVDQKPGMTKNELYRQMVQQNQNGGNVNVETRNDASAAPGNLVSDGGQGWNAGTGTGEPVGTLEEGTAIREEGPQSGAALAGDQGTGIGEAAANRSGDSRVKVLQRLASQLKLPRVNSLSLGIPEGTEKTSIRVLPQETWTPELQEVARNVQQETGLPVTFVLGRIPVKNRQNGVRAVYMPTGVIIQADNPGATPQQLADHETYHFKADEARRAQLNQRVAERLLEKYSVEELSHALDKYKENLVGIVDDEGMTEEEFLAAFNDAVLEEFLADAYAGINAFGAHAERYQGDVESAMDELYMGKVRNQDNGTRQTNGPNENTAGEGGVKYSEDAMQDTIYPGMDDAQRTDVLKKKEFYAPIYANADPVTGAQILKLKGMYITEARSLLTELARQCGDFRSDLYNADIDLSFAYSNKSLKESVNKQTKRGGGGGAVSFGKMLTLLPEICEAAVEIEAHTDRYVETARADGNLKEMHVLVGAFMDGDNCVPVQLEIKEYLAEAGLTNKLYVTVTMKNEAGVTPRISNAEMASENARSRPASVISLADLIENVKDDTGSLVKYLPDQMLTEEQRLAKEKALAEDEIRLGDMRYEFAVEQGNVQKAQTMLSEKAEEAGYSASDDWRMAHRAPNRNSGVTIDNADEVYGGDGSIHSMHALQYYGEGRSYDAKAISVLYKAWRDPEGSITVYRAVPADVKDGQLRNGDWVSPTREYAQEHGERYFEDGFRILEQDVPVKHLYVDGNSIHEFGYDNGRATEVYKNTENNVKLAEVTYDDKGKLIPLSQRFDERRKSVRYSADDTSAMEEELEMRQSQQFQDRLMEDGGSAAWVANQKRIEVLRQQMKRDPETIQKRNERDLQTDGTEPAKVRVPKKKAEKKVAPVSESKPTLAKQDLRKNLLHFFSVPEGQRQELGTVIDAYADRLIKNGALTEDDRRRFFDRMYASGVMEVPADELYTAGRELLRGGRIYVNDSIRAEFGDDWQDFRRQAFAAGIYLTSDKHDGGVDHVNSYMAEYLPSLFDSEETDLRMALERIVQVAEEGKSQQVSLAEYTAQLAGEQNVPESEFLDAMERHMDWALRTFAEKAELEVKLRDRTGVKIAQEREAAEQSRYKQSAREEARRIKERKQRMELREQQRQQKELRELQQKTLKSLQWLSKNRQRAPEELRETWDEVLGDIDLFAVSAANEMRWSDRYGATWKDLAEMYQEAKDKDPNFMPSKDLERIVSRLNDKKIGEMDIGALQDLYKAAVGLQKEFHNRNNVINDEMNRMFEEVYEDTKAEIESAPGGFKGKHMDKLFNMEQLTPMNVLQRMGGWDPNGTFFSMAKQLERGERDIRAYTVKANRMLEEFLTEHEDWVKKCDGQGKDGIWYEMEVPELLELNMGHKPIFGDTFKVYFTPAQKVHMYLESKNLDNLRHMLGGRTFVDKKLYSEGKRQEALSQGRTVRLAPETVKAMVANLTDEERALADVLERYYNTFAKEEINRVSNVLYGYDKAMGKNYAPIFTNQNYTKSELGVYDATAEGVGHMKGRVAYSKNPSYNISALDAFEKHVDQTARFTGMSIPARNWNTLLDWREKNNSTGDVITHKWGEEGKKYIEGIIEDLQSGKAAPKTGFWSRLAEKVLRNYISAVFGANPSIVLKQMGSIPMAAPYLDFKNFPTPARIKNIDRDLIANYTQDLAWRTMGYTTPETKELKDNPNWTQTNKTVRFVFGGGAITAMDGWAASTLWPWAENKVRRDFPELEAGTDAYYKKVAELFEYAMSRSQSVSDETHQSTLRKSRNPFERLFTMFRSDSAQTYNTIRQKIGEARYYKRIGADKETQRKANKAVGTAFVASLSGLIWAEGISLIMALWKNKGKAYRDDEDELTVESIMSEAAMHLVGSMAGTVSGGEEVATIIGAVLTGEKWYDLETPGMEQLNGVINALMDAGGGVRDVVAGMWEIAENGGDVGKYLEEHTSDIVGGVKDLAETAAKYFVGLPVANVEAYLLGLLKWCAPGLTTAYEDALATANKAGLSGLTGDVLEVRVGNIMEQRGVESDAAAEILAGLYEDGYSSVVPGAIPTKVTIEGEENELNLYQQQVYGNIWGSIVAEHLEKVVSSELFEGADAERQSKLIQALYSYADAKAKAELYDSYKLSSSIRAMDDALKSGLSMDRVLDMKVPREKEDTDTGEQGYSGKFKDYMEMVENGVDPDEAHEIIEHMEQLEPEEGKTSVSNLQKCMVIANYPWQESMKEDALKAIMSDSGYEKYMSCREAGVLTYWYFTFLDDTQDMKTDYDANGKAIKGASKKDKVVAAIDGYERLTPKQKDALFLTMYKESGLKDCPWN